MNISQIHKLFLESSGICTDTRKLKKQNIFVALKGDNFDGNQYAEKALKNGAIYTIIDNKTHKTSEKHILVDNALSTLQELASYHRHYLNIPILALTGSNGKTTTKELINCVLSTKFKTTATIGNLNNHIGVPLTILSMNKNTQFGIVEMGANHVKEIDFLCSIAKPDFGYITNIGKAHLEGFKSIEGVLKGKTELYQHLKKHNKLVFLNLDDKKLLEASKEINTYGFSSTTNGDTQIQLQYINPNVIASYKSTTIQSNLIGEYNFNNIAAAIAIGEYFKISTNSIKDAIESYTPTNNRSQIINKDKHTIILDAYNANPSSMQAAINNFSALKHNSKVAFLGDMFELGKETIVEHQKIVDQISNTQIQEIYLIGHLFYNTKSTDNRIKKFKEFEELDIKETLKNKQKAILIKGSRGMKLERVLDLF